MLLDLRACSTASLMTSSVEEAKSALKGEALTSWLNDSNASVTLSTRTKRSLLADWRSAIDFSWTVSCSVWVCKIFVYATSVALHLATSLDSAIWEVFKVETSLHNCSILFMIAWKWVVFNGSGGEVCELLSPEPLPEHFAQSHEELPSVNLWKSNFAMLAQAAWKIFLQAKHVIRASRDPNFLLQLEQLSAIARKQRETK